MNLKDTLLHESGLLSLSQGDCDLFLISQANAITYRQLAVTKLHGNTFASGRLSIKNLEKEGYVASKYLPGNAREKYYVLTAKGRKRIERLFGGSFLKRMSVQLEKRPPLSHQQLPHRIHTGDMYFAYLSNPSMDRFPIWQSEVLYAISLNETVSPRCDALLQSGYQNYYIEQDDGTQGDAVLKVKIHQYLKGDLFLGKKVFMNVLVFTIHTNVRERPTCKPSFSIYRILLKAIRVWNALEKELRQPLNFNAFCMQFEDNSSPNLLHLSQNDRNILQNICYQHPSLSLDEVKLLKNTFLYDTTQKENQRMEQDLLFSKRLRTKFYPIIDSKEQSILCYRMRSGMRLCVLPNHRLPDYLPFSLFQEYHFSAFLEKLLFHMGLHDLTSWSYSAYKTLSDNYNKSFSFYNVFSAESGIRIIAEDIVHDLGGRERVRYYLASHTHPDKFLFLLFVATREDAVLFLNQLNETFARKENQTIKICFLDKSASLFEHPESQYAYFQKKTPAGSLWLPCLLDYDPYFGELNLIERRV